jgi:hypothetical protein
VSQAVEGLPSKHEALSSNFNTAKKKKIFCDIIGYFPYMLMKNIILALVKAFQ